MHLRTVDADVEQKITLGEDIFSAMTPFDSQITFVYVSDLERADRFYSVLLGLPLALDQGSCRIYQVTATAYLGLCQRPTVQATESVILTLVTEDVDGWHQKLRAADVPIDTPPTMNTTYHIYHLFVRDPDGWRVELQRFEDPRWNPAL